MIETCFQKTSLSRLYGKGRPRRLDQSDFSVGHVHKPWSPYRSVLQHSHIQRSLVHPCLGPGKPLHLKLLLSLLGRGGRKADAEKGEIRYDSQICTEIVADRDREIKRGRTKRHRETERGGDGEREREREREREKERERESLYQIVPYCVI